jgi:hypothetical protein
VATGPYRAPIERPPACERHAESIAAEVCARCKARVCLDCLGFGGARFVCFACARVARRREGFVRAIAVLVVALAGALPGLLALQVPREAESPTALVVKYAVRNCEPRELDFVLSSFEMHGRDREIVSMVEKFSAECETSEQTAGFLRRARARLAAP